MIAFGGKPIMVPKSIEPANSTGAGVGIGFAPKKYLITSCSTIASPKVTRIWSACGRL